MATKVLFGCVTSGIRHIKKADHLPTVWFGSNGEPCIVVTEFGDTRTEIISPKVAEILIANGMPYGN